MRSVLLPAAAGLDEWRAIARPLLAAGIPPEAVSWAEDGPDRPLFPADARPEGASAPTMPRAFFDLAGQAVLHRDRQRFALLYQLAWRAMREPGLMAIAADPLVARLEGMAKAVRRDIHKMHAFVRFRAVRDDDGERFLAWFEPDHHVVAAAAPFFRDRFAAMRWSILTPDRSVQWNGGELLLAPGLPRPADLHEDAAEGLWLRYYAAIFNPARLKVRAMRAEMPRRYWRNLPEAALIDPLIASAAARTDDMVRNAPSLPNARPQRFADAPPTVIAAAGLPTLRHEAASCRRCPLWQPATQTVFGEGPADATLMLVGEQPGDQEDLAGRPFVGPAGQVLDEALAAAGIDRQAVYLTNAVKHFKFAPRGKRRIHQRPDAGEVMACRWWLAHELAAVRPRLVVALGATAIHALLGRALPIGRHRGQVLSAADGTRVLVTAHPSYALRIPEPEGQARERALLAADLKTAMRELTA